MLKVFNQVPNKIQSFLKSHNVHPNLASSQDFAKKIPLFSPLIILRVGNFAIQNWNYPVLDCNFQAYKRLAFQREFIKHGLLGQLPASLHPLLHWHIPSQWTSMERTMEYSSWDQHQLTLNQLQKRTPTLPGSSSIHTTFHGFSGSWFKNQLSSTGIYIHISILRNYCKIEILLDIQQIFEMLFDIFP